MTARRWRQLEAGRDSSTGKATAMSDPVLAHMAYAVRVSPDQLVDIGKDEAAAILLEIIRQQAASGDPTEVTADIPAYVTREGTQDWEWEIWAKLTLTSAEDKSLMIEYLKFMRDRAARTEGAGQEAQRRTG